ncbi:hypothetical protein ACVIB9_005727 [Escherichia coli]
MKSFLFLFFTFNFFNAQQSYEVNKEIIYNIKFNEKNNESIIYINVNDDSYFLKTYKNSDNSYAIIYDLKNNKKNYYEMIEIPNSNKYDLKFEKSERFYPDKLMNYNHYDYVTSSIENTEELRIYFNKKRKKTYKIFKFETTESEIDYFPAYKFSCLHPFEFNQNLKYDKPLLVKKSIILYKENTCECNLKTTNDVIFTLKNK